MAGTELGRSVSVAVLRLIVPPLVAAFLAVGVYGAGIRLGVGVLEASAAYCWNYSCDYKYSYHCTDWQNEAYVDVYDQTHRWVGLAYIQYSVSCGAASAKYWWAESVCAIHRDHEMGLQAYRNGQLRADSLVSNCLDGWDEHPLMFGDRNTDQCARAYAAFTSSDPYYRTTCF